MSEKLQSDRKTSNNYSTVKSKLWYFHSEITYIVYNQLPYMISVVFSSIEKMLLVTS